MNWRTHLFPLRGLILHWRDVEIVHRSLHRVKFAVSEQTLPRWRCWTHSVTGFHISILAALERSVTLLCTWTFLTTLSLFIVSTPSHLHCWWEERKVKNNWCFCRWSAVFLSKIKSLRCSCTSKILWSPFAHWEGLNNRIRHITST